MVTGILLGMVGLILVIVVSLYLYVSYQGYKLLKELGNEAAWMSFLPHVQVFAYVELLSRIKNNISLGMLALIFIGVPALANGMGAVVGFNATEVTSNAFTTYFSSGSVSLDILNIFVIVLFVYLTVVVVKNYTPDSSKFTYGILSVFFGPLALAIWAHRHRSEIVSVFNGVDTVKEDVIDGVVVVEETITEDVKKELFDDESKK